MFTCVIGLFLNLVNRVDCAQSDLYVRNGYLQTTSHYGITYPSLFGVDCGLSRVETLRPSLSLGEEDTRKEVTLRAV